MIWTDERLAQLKEWADKGFSMSDAARYFGVTKSAIAGVVRRNRPLIRFHCSVGNRAHIARWKNNG